MQQGTRRTRDARFVALAWGLWALAMLGVASVSWFDRLMQEAGRPDQAIVVPFALAPVLACFSAATVGAVVAAARPRHPVGWLLLALGLCLSLSGFETGYVPYGLIVRPGALPGAELAALYYPGTVFAALGCVGFVLLLTPNGSLPKGRGWRWWAWFSVAAPAVLLLALPLASTDFGPSGPSPTGSDHRFAFGPGYRVDNPLDFSAFGGAALALNLAALALTLLGVLVAVVCLVLRFRHAVGVERQQLRWVAFAAATTGVLVLAIAALIAAGDTVVVGSLGAICLGILPVAVGAAVLRYRLYDLDRIISRTLAYALLTLLLGGAYALVVLGFGQLLDQQSSLVVAGATLAVAAAFQPARRRVQALVDRRFNRRRYDAAETIEGFRARLREQIDLDTLTTELLTVTDQTMQPTHASLWLHPHAPGR